MPSTYTPDSTNNPTSFTEPDDGDNEDAASVNVFLEGLADKAAHMNLPEQSNTEKYRLASRSITRVSKSAPISSFDISNAPDWTFGGNTAPISSPGGTWMVAINSPGIDQEVTQILEIPHGASVTEVRVTLKGSAGHGALPATMPHLKLYKLAVSGGVATLLGEIDDPSSGTVTYETAHQVILTGGGVDFTSFTVDNSAEVYFVVLSNERGANSQIGLSYFGSEATFTLTRQDDGAA